MALKKRRGPGVPFAVGDGRPKGRKKGVPNKSTKELKTFAREFLESAEYRANVKARIMRGDAERLEVTLYHYAYGKPKETLEISPDVASFVDLVRQAQRAS